MTKPSSFANDPSVPSTAELSCRELVEFLDDYVDGTLPAVQQRRFEEHLAECPQCVDYLASYRTTMHLEKTAFAAAGERVSGSVPAALVAAILAARRTPG